MNKILIAVFGLASLSNGVKLNHLAGADVTNTSAEIEALTGSTANSKNSGFRKSNCGCDGCCGGNEVNIDINF